MGFNLADFGLMAGGAQEVFDQRARRERDEEDRAYTKKKRERDEELAQAALDEARRNQQYAAELRSVLPKYLAGGEQATPAKPAVPGEVLDPFAVDGGEVARTAQSAVPAADNTQGLYKALQDVAAKHGRLDHYEKIQERIKKATDEGVIDFIAKARQGLPEPELLAAFNQNGKVKLKGLRRAGDDEFAAVTEDGQPIRLNLTSLTESLLAPKDLLIHRDKGEKTAATLEGRRLTLEQQERANQARAGEREARIIAATAQADLAAARADRVRNPIEKPAKPPDWGKREGEVRRAAKAQFTSVDRLNKKVTDEPATVAATAMAMAMWRRDPDGFDSAAEALEAAAEVLQGAQGQAANEGSTLKFDSAEKQAAWVRNRAQRLAKMRMGADEAAPARPAAPKAAKEVAAPVLTAPPPISERVVGKVYQTPRGKVQWTEGGWLPVS